LNHHLTLHSKYSSTSLFNNLHFIVNLPAGKVVVLLGSLSIHDTELQSFILIECVEYGLKPVAKN